MTAQPIAPVIPSASRPGHRKGRLRAAGPLPLASPPDRTDVIDGVGRIDASGRVADRVIISALGWRGGDRLTLTAGSGVMVARRDPGGMAPGIMSHAGWCCCGRCRMAPRAAGQIRASR